MPCLAEGIDEYVEGIFAMLGNLRPVRQESQKEGYRSLVVGISRMVRKNRDNSSFGRDLYMPKGVTP